MPSANIILVMLVGGCLISLTSKGSWARDHGRPVKDTRTREDLEKSLDSKSSRIDEHAEYVKNLEREVRAAKNKSQPNLYKKIQKGKKRFQVQQPRWNSGTR